MTLFSKQPDATKIDTIIGNGTVIEGTLTSRESISVEGTVRGKLETEGNVVVGANGVVEADILANTVLIGGSVSGNIVARTRLEITSSGKLCGDIQTGSLIIAEGVLFEGKCRMLTDERVALPSPNDVIAQDDLQME